MQILITGKGIELTLAIEQYIDKKFTGLERFFTPITKAEVVVGMETKHHVKGDIFMAECRLTLPGSDAFASAQEKTLYQAIDALRDHLEAELKKRKVKLHGNIKKNKNATRASKEYQPEE